ncbi:response regulator transcription factor [Streptomyces sp. QH1-20]|uniref:response regulator transcription factor n=1 Tax=Streptomyces sp. QH1-20 TaxID=3240934 RepID=UPI003511B52A
MNQAIPQALAALSEREREVLGHLADGHTYAAIARRMGVSAHTVDTYLRRIRGKTGVNNRTQLAVLAVSFHQPRVVGMPRAQAA